ncbi:MAG: NAD(P)H-binding protein [Myxococcales bacterium]|nr:NAD(P)H-binding protein [Myxococcales bacterium]
MDAPEEVDEMKILVMGATGGSGRAAVAELLAAGHEVTALVRRPDALKAQDGLRLVVGDAMDPEAVDDAVAGQDAVLITLGITENPLRVRFLGPAHTPLTIRSQGTQNAIQAMRRHGVRRLVVQTTYGVGATKARLRWVERALFWALLKPQIQDSEVQNQAVVDSGLEWVLAQPVHLSDGPEAPAPFTSTEGEVGRMQVTRASVGRFLAEAVGSPRWVGQTVALSGPAAA